MKIEIKNRYTGLTILEGEAVSLRVFLEQNRRVDFSEANLIGADLRGADLRGVDLFGADFREADLRGVDLYGADFSGADLRGAEIKKSQIETLIRALSITIKD